jgi:hypothetical protein
MSRYEEETNIVPTAGCEKQCYRGLRNRNYIWDLTRLRFRVGSLEEYLRPQIVYGTWFDMKKALMYEIDNESHFNLCNTRVVPWAPNTASFIVRRKIGSSSSQRNRNANGPLLDLYDIENKGLDKRRCRILC